jgi:hypothetical protein
VVRGGIRLSRRELSEYAKYGTIFANIHVMAVPIAKVMPEIGRDTRSYALRLTISSVR